MRREAGTATNVGVEAEFYTVLLRAGSYYIDAAMRDVLLRAQQAGAARVRIKSVTACAACSCDHSETIALADVLGFVAHDSAGPPGSRNSNVVRLRAFG